MPDGEAARLSSDLVLALRANGVSADDLVAAPAVSRPRPVRKLVGAEVLVDVARSEAGRRLIRLEVLGRRWAAGHGVQTPRVIASSDDGAWLVAERIHAGPHGGAHYVRAALDVAERIKSAPAPSQDLRPTVWRAPRRTVLLRAARGLAAGLPLHRFRTARSAYAQLPTVATCHGDFYFRNVLLDEATGGLVVIDWEYLAQGPRHLDAVRMWSTLTEEEDRGLLLEELLRRSGAEERRDIAVLAEWLSLRLFAENVTAPRAEQNAEDARHARAVMREGREAARRLLR